jgi:hypothetical protein
MLQSTRLLQSSLRELLWIVLAVSLGSAIAGCQWQTRALRTPPREVLTGTNEEVRARLLNLIPAGTDAAQAKQRLEELGFDVAVRDQSDSLFADLHEPTDSSWVSKRWIVVVDAPDN